MASADASNITKLQEVTTPHPFCRLQNPSKWEIARMILGILTGFVALRLCIMISIIFVQGTLVVILHHLGLRFLCVYTLRFSCRCLLLASGHLWIPVHDDNKIFEKGNCPKIIVSNHLSNMEILHLLTLPFQDSSGNPVLPHFVTKESIFGLPVIGTITRDVLGSIGVSRKKAPGEKMSQPPSKSVADQILERVNNGGIPNTVGYGPIVIFPEGTTTNGSCLLAFKTGAFVPMVPVTPVLYSFGANASDPQKSAFLPTYESIWAPAYLWRLLCQPYHRFECRFLDTIAPDTNFPVDASAKEVDQTSVFAQKVRRQMAFEGNLPMLSEEYDYKHKLKYHNGLRKALLEHPRGAKHAMCFAPMQKVFDNSKANKTTLGYDVVKGTKFRVASTEKKKQN